MKSHPSLHTHTAAPRVSKRHLQPPAVLPAFHVQPTALSSTPAAAAPHPFSLAAQPREDKATAVMIALALDYDENFDMQTAAPARDLNFRVLSPLTLMFWLLNHPNTHFVEDRDSRGNSLLWAAAYKECKESSSSLVRTLVEEAGADVNGRTSNGSVPIHHAMHADVLGFLIESGAEPVVWNDKGWTPLMHQVRAGRPECVARLLKDPRVRASIDTVARGDDFRGFSALHFACFNNVTPTAKLAILRHLLLAGADPTLPNEDGLNCLQILREYPPVEPLELILVEEGMDGQRAASLIKARQVAVGAGRSEGWRCVRQSRLQRGEAMPSIELGTEDEEGEEFGSLTAFLMGVQSEEGRNGMPPGVFVVVMSMLIPPWHALREGTKGVE